MLQDKPQNNEFPLEHKQITCTAILIEKQHQKMEL